MNADEYADMPRSERRAYWREQEEQLIATGQIMAALEAKRPAPHEPSAAEIEADEEESRERRCNRAWGTDPNTPNPRED